MKPKAGEVHPSEYDWRRQFSALDCGEYVSMDAGKVRGLARAYAETLTEVEALRKAFDAACAFIDSHAADPDITSEMVRTYGEFKRHRAALAAGRE